MSEDTPHASASGTNLLPPRRIVLFLVYSAMLVGAVVLFLAIRGMGERLPSGELVEASWLDSKSTHGSEYVLPHILLALAVIIVVTRIMGALFGLIQQPPVLGEVIGGILLGPSLLGRVAPEVTAFLLPHEVVPFLNTIAQLGIILYMFIVGLELDLRAVRKSGHVTLAISHASIVVPFLFGALLALYLYPTMSDGRVGFTVFALFMGVSLSITAFPVLARILTDRKVHKTRLGILALTCAAVDDATAWCLLAFVVSFVQERVGDAVVTVIMTLCYVVAILTVVAPLVARLLPRLEGSYELSRGGLAMVFVAMLMSSLATEYIGIHAIFGAFLLGAIVPDGSRVAKELSHRLDDIVGILFLPAFFAFTGMRTEIGLVSGLGDWMLCGLIIAVACAGKFGGTVAAARFTGLRWRDASALGILMNTRGLVELIVLNIGLDLGVISPRLFTMLVLMALVTTFMTTPILHFLTRRGACGLAQEVSS